MNKFYIIITILFLISCTQTKVVTEKPKPVAKSPVEVMLEKAISQTENYQDAKVEFLYEGEKGTVSSGRYSGEIIKQNDKLIYQYISQLKYYINKGATKIRQQGGTTLVLTSQEEDFFNMISEVVLGAKFLNFDKKDFKGFEKTGAIKYWKFIKKENGVTSTIWLNPSTLQIKKAIVESGFGKRVFTIKNIKYNQNISESNWKTAPQPIVNTYKPKPIPKTNRPPAALPSYKDPNGLYAENSYLPDFEGLWADGSKFHLNQQNNKVTILDFWFINCPPCKKATPYIQKIYEEYKHQGVEVIGVNPIDRTDFVNNYNTKNKVTFPTVYTPKETCVSLGAVNFPVIYVLDSQQKVVHAQTGFSEFDADLIKLAVLESLEQ